MCFTLGREHFYHSRRSSRTMAVCGARGMNKTHLTYLLMIAIFAGGLWGILRLGSGLRAARNVAGEWEIVWSDATGGEALPDRMTVDQSGDRKSTRLNS